MNVYLLAILLVSLLAYIAELVDYREAYLPSSASDTATTDFDFPRCSHSSACRLFYILATIVLIAVGGLRYHVGTDYWAYEWNAPMYAATAWESIVTYDEPGIKIIAKFVSLFTKDIAPGMLFIATAITIGLYALTIYNYSRHLLVPLLLFVLIGCWTDSFNAVRQCLAASVFFCSIPFIQKRDFRGFALTVFMASLFHKTAIGLMPVYYFAHAGLNAKSLFSKAAILTLYFFAYDYVINNVSFLMQVHSDGSYVTLRVNVLRVMAGCAPGLVSWLYFQGKHIDDERLTYVNLMLLHAMIWIMASQSAYLARFAIYSAPLLTLSITRCMDLLNVRERHTICCMGLVLYFAFWWHEIDKSSNLRVFYWIWDR